MNSDVNGLARVKSSVPSRGCVCPRHRRQTLPKMLKDYLQHWNWPPPGRKLFAALQPN
jgi:hypothetical protein